MKVHSVSNSSDKKLARCEQQYFYRYDEGLKARIKAKGLYMGDWMHQLLEQHYTGKWQTRFKQLEKEWDKLFQEEREMYEEKGFTPVFAHALMSHYADHWAEEDANWEILLVEGKFKLPVKILGNKPVIFKCDLIVRDNRDGVICLVEAKNHDELPDANERILAPQVHTYCYLLSKIKTKQFPKGIKIGRIIWNYLRTSPVPAPQILKNGSLSKRKINTDRRSYLAAMKAAKIHPKGDEVIGVESFLASLPETLSLLRVNNRPNFRIGEMFVRQMVERARRAQQIKKPLRTWARDCQWMCEYKKLCEADMIGKSDRNTIIKKDFVTHIGNTEVK